jgi:hypothetical protein
VKLIPDQGRQRKLLCGGLAWIGVGAVIAACLGPAWRNWSGTVVGPFGGIDAMLQTGILGWSVRTWWQPSLWVDLPIFFPVSGAIGFMDTLLGQAWLVWPIHALFHPTAAALYNWAYLGSLLLAAAGMAALWRAAGGSRWAAGVAALALVGAPYTLAQIGHLNQLPPPFVLLSLAALVAALRRDDAGLPSALYWWLLGVFLVLQAAWGWYGFAYAVVGVAILKLTWLVHRFRRRTAGWTLVWRVARQAVLPAVLAAVGVLTLAQPQLQLRGRYESFTRTEHQVRLGSADLQHFLNRGVYRSGPADWTGNGKSGADRYAGRDRQVLNPGWAVLLLAGVGWWRRGYLSFQRRRVGRGLLAVGTVGLVLSFGDSVGLPFTGLRFPLPLAWLRDLVPPFEAFREAWRFSWLMVIALAWWSAVAVEQMVEKQGHRLVSLRVPAVLILVVTLLSLPVEVPGLAVPLTGRRTAAGPTLAGPMLTLPAPENEYAEDVAEARWLLRVLETGRPATGGATGWVPPEIVKLREQLQACEQGEFRPEVIFAEMKKRGVLSVELTLRPDDEARLDFWREALAGFGAVRQDVWPHALYETYRLP